MGTNDLPHDPDQTIDPDTADLKVTVEKVSAATVGHIGPYHLLRVLGEGGMGEVWLTEQTKPIHRTVALKLIKAGMDTKAVVARFESERQALALMDHPSIARVYDAGSTTAGRPYFVMEYVPGVPITKYCDGHRLTLKERLELFLQVCDGVQHAHQKAIIHRDLKPSNVLVVEQDNKAVPKIIDFGLAKATEQRLTDKTMFTELGAMMGTPGYMSPEQADQSELNIDTRTDVYSLGVILYQLLVGALPFEAKTFRTVGLEALLRAIREEEPAKPSTKIRLMGDASNASAEKRKEEPRSFARHLRGELDWITMKALEKDRTRRYGSPAELGADIRRYLHNEPVLAGPPSATYRARKFVRRHRFVVAAAASAAVLVIAFAVTMGLQARRIARERDRANQQAEVAQREADFMTNMFKVSNPSESRGNTITAREILDTAAKQIETGLAKEPQVRADLMYTMAITYDNLGLYNRAQDLHQQAFDIRRRVLGPDDRKTLDSMSHLGSTMLSAGYNDAGTKVLQNTLKLQQQILGPDDPDTLATRGFIGDALLTTASYQQAENFQRETLGIQERVLGPENLATLRTESRLAETLAFEQRYPEAEKLQRDALEIESRTLGPDDPATLQSTRSLASILTDEGNYAAAENLLTNALPIDRRILGPEHAITLDTLGSLAYVYLKELKYPEAEKLFQELVASDRHLYGANNTNDLADMEELAVTYAREKRYSDAAALFQQALEIANSSKTSALIRIAWYNFACAAAITGHREDAFRYLREAVDNGFTYPDQISGDKDLQSLHSDPRFNQIVEKARAGAAQPEKK
jgi:eukaryotic-like serine/threonine-protein kinase